jgi:hypothetical protein
MKRSTLLFASALTLLISLGGSVRADLIAWTYSWQRDPISVAADGDGTGGVSFTNESLAKDATGNSDIVATNLRVFSTATASTPDQLKTGGAYTLSLTLTDSASGQSNANNPMTFTGKLSGTFSANNSNLTNVFNSPTMQSVVLGGNTYTVTIGPYSPPGPPSASNAGAIAAFVTVTPGTTGPGGGGTGPGVSDVPEPSTMLLAGLGLSFLGGAAWRKRRLTLAKAAE